MNNETFDVRDGPFFIDYVTEIPLADQIVNGYHLDIAITSTHYSIVYLCSKLDDHNKKVIKFIKRREDNLEMIENELYVMKMAKHDNILKLEDCFPYKEYVCLITPYAKFNSLQDLIVLYYSGGIPEEIAASIMKQIIDGVTYLHASNIWHRDIKPANIFIMNKDWENIKVVIGDFGLAKQYSENETESVPIATEEYAAPEILKNKNYNYSVDIWSLGITLFVMLTGLLPYEKSKCKEAIKKGELNYSLLEDRLEALDLIKQMCMLDPGKRISLDNALKHAWFESYQKKADIERTTYDFILPKEEIEKGN